VQRGEALWAIADRMRPEGVSVNQMMIAIYQANAAAFGGNINLLRAGATLRIPENADLNALTRTAANAEVQRQTDEWQGRSPGQLRLLPPTETVAREPEPAPAPVSRDTRAADAEVAAAAAAAAAAAEAEESRRLIELRNAELRNIQDQAAAVDEPEVAVAANAEPGVDLDEVFADEEPAPAPVDEEPAVTPAPVPAPTPAVATEPSLVSQAIGWLRSPLLWIGLGVALVLFAALWFVRRRRQETEDVTGRWEALEAETDEDPMTRDATERMRRQLPEETIVVEEQHAQQLRPEPEAPARRAAAPAAAASRAPRAAPAPDETLSSQTVINLDQADAIAEADFHVAYGLYDQAAELVQKAIEAAPERRDLKLKLLEVFFMWGNKDAFLKAAQGLRSEIGQAEDADWDKVVIMGRQICPDERLFTEATTGGGRVDVDLQAGDSPLDLAFDDAAAADVGAAASAGLDFQLDSSDERPAPKPAAKPAKPAKAGRDDMLDIGSKTAAGLEAALFAPMGRDDDEDTGKRTSPDISADSLAVTQESPTIERPGNTDWATLESTALHSSEAPTVETPTIESPAARSATGVTKKLAMPGRGESPTVEQPALGGASAGEYTAEIDLDDLGLDVKDLEGLPGDLGDLPMAAGSDTDTREQKVLRDDDSLLSATGVTKVLHEEEDFTASRTSVMADQDATMLAPGFDEGTSTLTGTEVLEGRLEVNDQSGNTALVRSLKGQKESVDLDLADLTAALQGADTVEQPRTSSFSNDVFGSGSTPLDLDVGSDAAVGDDDPTGTEEASPLDPQTMTEVGTKLDLARAYIDMGDPEGARSILEEVLDEGDSNQRREAQGLIDVLSA
jgi:pilus assembly protein FimV